MSATNTTPLKKPPPVWPIYSWRAKSTNARLVYIRDGQLADQEVVKLRGPLGFDLEWRPNFVKGRLENPVALIQLSDKDTILLIQVSSMTEFPGKLEELLENPDIVKAGVGIQYDCKKLYADWHVTVRNCVDLSLLARCVDNARWKGRYTDPIGLSRLVETYEELSLPKGRIQRSNWEAHLSEIQQEYAANDAHSGFIIYCKFAEMAQAMAVAPKSIYYSFNAVDGLLCEPSGTPWAPVNPDYDPGPPPPPKPPKPTQTAESAPDASAETKAAAPMSIRKPPLLTPAALDLDRRRLDKINGGSGYYLSPAPPTLDPGRRRAEMTNRTGNYMPSTPPMFDPGYRRPDIPSRGSSSLASPMFDPTRCRPEITNGGVNHNPPPPRTRPDPMLGHGRKTSTDESESPRPKKSHRWRPRRSRGGGGASRQGPM